MNGNGGAGAGGDPLAAALAAGGQGGEMSDPTGAQATSMTDLTGMFKNLHRGGYLNLDVILGQCDVPEICSIVINYSKRYLYLYLRDIARRYISKFDKI